MSPRELERHAEHKLAELRHIEEVSGNVSATCRYYGISRRCYYKWRRRPGHQLQVDLKFIEPLGQTWKKKRYYQYTAIDDCTRLRNLRAYRRDDQRPAIQFVDHLLSKLPFQVEQVQIDNGRGFGSAFHRLLLDKGTGHVKFRHRTPSLNGKVERSHRIDSDEFYRLLEGEVIDDANLFAERLQQWEDHYNYDCPHGALAAQTPYECLRQKARAPLS